MKFSYTYATTVLVGICTFIKYGMSCDIECDTGYRCVMRRSTCDYPPCPYFPTCVQNQHHHHHHHHHNNRRHPRHHRENNQQRHEGRHSLHTPYSSHILSALSDTTTESQVIDTAPSHRGTCPAPSGYGPCITTCRNDGDCQTNEKCCGNGCGQTCTTVSNVIKDKPGTCPRRVRLLFRDCSSACNHDNDCPGIQKCCSTACGSMCSDPCFHWLTPVSQRSTGLGTMWKLPLICRS